jgi:dATP pyrophosphohydrolase
MSYKIPLSVLVVIYTPQLEVLLLERADHPGFWQSVTGSCDALDEPLMVTAQREVMEETGLDASAYDLCDWQIQNQYDIYEHWRHRYPPGTLRNTEHVFGLKVPTVMAVTLSAREHLNYLWLPWAEAAEKCFSASNKAAIQSLPQRV